MSQQIKKRIMVEFFINTENISFYISVCKTYYTCISTNIQVMMFLIRLLTKIKQVLYRICRILYFYPFTSGITVNYLYMKELRSIFQDKSRYLLVVVDRVLKSYYFQYIGLRWNMMDTLQHYLQLLPIDEKLERICSQIMITLFINNLV